MVALSRWLSLWFREQQLNFWKLKLKRSTQLDYEQVGGESTPKKGAFSAKPPIMHWSIYGSYQLQLPCSLVLLHTWKHKTTKGQHAKHDDVVDHQKASPRNSIPDDWETCQTWSLSSSWWRLGWRSLRTWTISRLVATRSELQRASQKCEGSSPLENWPSEGTWGGNQPDWSLPLLLHLFQERGSSAHIRI